MSRADDARIQAGEPNAETDKLLRSELPELVDPSDGTPALEVKTPKPKGTIFSTVFNVANAALGAGILAYPYGFAQGGWLGALGVMIMIALLSGTGNYCLVRYCDEFCPGAASYQEVFLLAMGRGGEAFTILCAIINSFGTCVAYLVVIADNMVPVFNILLDTNPTPTPTPTPTPFLIPSPSPSPSPSPFPSSSPSPFPSPSPSPSPFISEPIPWYVTRPFVITLFSVVFILPLCCLKRITLLGYSSFFSVISILIVVFTVIFYSVTGTYDIDGNPTYSFKNDSTELWENVSVFRSGFNFLQVFPIVAFSYQAHVTTPPLYNELANRSPQKMYISLGIAMAVVSILYLLCGFFGYVTFGNNLANFDTGSDILSIYKSTPLLVASNVCVSFVAIFSFPILHFVARLSLIDVVVGVGKKYGHKISRKSEVMHYSLTLAFFFSCLALAIAVPNINVVIGLVGGGVVVCMMLILPGFLLRLLAIENQNKPLEIFSIAFIITGCIILILSVGISLYNDF